MKKILKFIIKFFSDALSTRCPRCKKGYLRYYKKEWNVNKWIHIYKCEKCKLKLY